MRVPKIWDTWIDNLQLTIDKLKVSGFPSSFLRNYAETGRRRNHQCMLTADGEAGDTLLQGYFPLIFGTRVPNDKAAKKRKDIMQEHEVPPIRPGLPL